MFWLWLESVTGRKTTDAERQLKPSWDANRLPECSQGLSGCSTFEVDCLKVRVNRMLTVFELGLFE
jgi:hypothetical protein